MNNYRIAFRIDIEDDDYIRSISSGVCSINDIYKAIYGSFCDSLRRNKRKGKKNVKTNTANKAQRGKKAPKGGEDKNPGRRRTANRKNTKRDKG